MTEEHRFIVTANPGHENPKLVAMLQAILDAKASEIEAAIDAAIDQAIQEWSRDPVMSTNPFAMGRDPWAWWD